VGSWDYSSITIRPSGDVREINADLTEPILCVAGSNILIDGRVNGIGGSNQLTFSNSSGPAINIINYNGVENIALEYLNLEGVAENTIAGIVNVLSHGASATTGIVIENCKIGNPNGNVANGIYAEAFSSGNIEATVQNCEIANVWHPEVSSKGISVNEGCEAWTITSNSFYQTSTRTATAGNTHYGIYINGGEGHTISNNYIGGSGPLCAGTAWTIAGEYANKFVGITWTSVQPTRQTLRIILSTISITPTTAQPMRLRYPVSGAGYTWPGVMPILAITLLAQTRKPIQLSLTQPGPRMLQAMELE